MLDTLQSADKVQPSFTDYLKQQQVSCITPLPHGGKENRKNWGRYYHETQVHSPLLLGQMGTMSYFYYSTIRQHQH